MVAAGGGGTESCSAKGGCGGTLNGTPNNSGSYATQTSGAAFGYAIKPNYDASAGGGGYWGGINPTRDAVRGGGGSSYISGYAGAIAIKSQTDITPRLDKNGKVCTNGTTDITCSYHYSGLVFKDTDMISGDETMPSHQEVTSQLEILQMVILR